MSIETPPPTARQHCRHYSYERGLEGGPRCAAGVDMSAPGSSSPCMPDATGCPKREDWTDVERATWEKWQADRTQRMLAAMAAVPALQGNDTAKVDCPSCDGRITYVRIPKRAYIECSTPHCTQFEANVRGLWPTVSEEEADA